MPPSARLAWWGTSWLRGHLGPDDMLDGVLVDDSEVHRVGDPDRGPGLLGALADARRNGLVSIGAAFPAPGIPVGLGGPAALTREAMEAGEVALLLGTGTAWIPLQDGDFFVWHVEPADRRPPPDLGDADRGLRVVVRDSANALAALDVAKWGPEIADGLHDLRTAVPLAPPPGVPQQAVVLAGRALHLLDLVALATEPATQDAALSAHELLGRERILADIERASRLALTAACSPDGWPPLDASASR